MYRYWLANIPGMTPSKYEFIYRNCSCAEELYMLSDRAIEKMTGLSQKVLDAGTSPHIKTLH